MKIRRLRFHLPHRDDVWHFIEDTQISIESQARADDNAHAVAGTLAAVSSMRGSRRGNVLELGFMVVVSVVSVVLAMLPKPHVWTVSCWLCSQRIRRVYYLRWLAWAFVFNPLQPVDRVCPDGHVAELPELPKVVQ